MTARTAWPTCLPSRIPASRRGCDLPPGQSRHRAPYQYGDLEDPGKGSWPGLSEFADYYESYRPESHWFGLSTIPTGAYASCIRIRLLMAAGAGTL